MGGDKKCAKTCEHCVIARDKRKNVRKESVAEKATISGHRLYLDLSKVNVKLGTSENICKATGKKWSNFTVTKSGMVDRTCENLHRLKSQNIPVCYIQLDPAGKNQKLAKHAGGSD